MPSPPAKFAEYLKTPAGKAAKKRASDKYNRSPAHALSNQRWRKRNKAKAATHGVLNYRIKKGEIVRLDNCEDCGTECTPHGHHEDYSKPLDVIWVCPPCHRQRHSILGDA